MESVRNFREAVNASVALQGEVRALNPASPAALVELGSRHGFAFTADEFASAASSAQAELTDFELEMVAGGTLPVGQMAANVVPIGPEKKPPKSSSSSYC
jgi:predicted ribosomally synthesized peptide with nif11-like leader